MNTLLKKHSKEDLINHLVSSFIEKHHIKTKNKLILDCIKKSKNSNSLPLLDCDYSFTSIQNEFESLVNDTKRNKHGIVYTPAFIVDYIVNKTVSRDNTSICDPSCGTGVFLIHTTKRLYELTGRTMSEIIEQNIYGADILEEHIRYCKILLTLLMLSTGEDKLELTFNLKTCNSLTFDWKKQYPNGFDVVIGNPPYLRIQDIPEKEKIQLKKKWLTCIGSYNLYFSFFELGMDLINDEGGLGYITANSFFTSSAGKTLRQWLQKNRYVDKILDFTHLTLFEATSYTCVVFLDKKHKIKIRYNYIDNYDDLNNLDKVKFNDNLYTDIQYDKWRLLRSGEREIIKKIENTGSPLGIISDIKSGIATLNDKIYFVPYSSEKLIEKLHDGKKYFIEQNITQNIMKISDLKASLKIIPTHKIIFPYEKINEKYLLIPEKIMKTKYPKCYEYLCSVKGALAHRDKGKKQYLEWYSYGRKQGFDMFGDKLLTPTFSKTPRFMLDDGVEDSFFCNGYAIVNSRVSLRIIQKILNSKIMRYYITRTSVFVEGGYCCFQKNFIERFGIPEFTEYEKKYILKTNDDDKLNSMLESKYNVDLSNF